MHDTKLAPEKSVIETSISKHPEIHPVQHNLTPALEKSQAQAELKEDAVKNQEHPRQHPNLAHGRPDPREAKTNKENISSEKKSYLSKLSDDEEELLRQRQLRNNNAAYREEPKSVFALEKSSSTYEAQKTSTPQIEIQQIKSEKGPEQKVEYTTQKNQHPPHPNFNAINTPATNNSSEMQIFTTRTRSGIHHDAQLAPQNTTETQIKTSAPQANPENNIKSDARPQNIQRERQNTINSAIEAYQAMKGGMAGIGTDEARLFRALEGKDATQIQKLRETYSELFKRDLDRDITSELKGEKRYLDRAEALLKGDPKISEASALKLEIDLPLNRRAEIFRQLENKTPAELNEIKATFKELYKTDMQEALTQKLKGPELQQALALLNGEPLAAKVIELNLVVASDQKRFTEIISSLDKNELSDLQKLYFEKYDKTLRDDINKKFEDPLRQQALLLLDGKHAEADANLLRSSLQEKNTALSSIREVFEGLPIEDRQRILAAYRDNYKSDLNQDINNNKIFSEADKGLASSIIGSGDLSPAEKLMFELRQGELRNQKRLSEEVLEIVRDQSYGEVLKIQNEFQNKYGLEISQAFQNKLDANTHFGLKLGLFGKAESLEDEAWFANLKHSRERTEIPALNKKIIDTCSEQGKILDDNLQKINEQYKKLSSQQIDKDDEEEFRFYSLLDFFDKNIKHYQSTRARLAAMFTNTSSVLSGFFGYFISQRSEHSMTVSIVTALIFALLSKLAIDSYLHKRGLYEALDNVDIPSRRNNAARKSRRSRRDPNRLSMYQPRRRGYSKTRRSVYKFRRTYNGNNW